MTRPSDDGPGGVAEDSRQGHGIMRCDQFGVDRLDRDRTRVADSIEGADETREVGHAITGHQAFVVGGRSRSSGRRRGYR